MQRAEIEAKEWKAAFQKSLCVTCLRLVFSHFGAVGINRSAFLLVFEG